MKEQDIRSFEWAVKHILDWSGLDAKTRTVLEALMAEIVTLAKR